MPMPGLRQNEELSELPRDATLPLPVVAAGPWSVASNARTKLSLSRSSVLPSRSDTNAQAHRTRSIPDLRRGGCVCAAATGGEFRPHPQQCRCEDGAFGHGRHPQADRPQHQERRRRHDRRDQVDLHQQGRQGRQRHGGRRRLPGRRRPRGPHRLVRSQDHRQRREGHGQHDQGRAQGQAGVQVQERVVARPGLHRHRPVGGAAERHARGRRMRRGRQATSSPRRPSRRPTARPTSRASGRTSPPPPRPAISTPPARCRATP